MSASSTSVQTTPTKTAPSIDYTVFILSGGFIALFALLGVVNLDTLSTLISTGFAWSTKLFGLYWQILLLVTFFIGLAIAIAPTGKVIMGGTDQPEISTFKWIAVIMCTLLAGGGVFWAAGEPIAHFISSPPLFGLEGGTREAAFPALAQAFMHWGFLAWAILGSLTSLIMMHLHYDRGLPLKPRTLLYPMFGDFAIKSWFGALVDAVCVVAVVAGTVGPIGFLGLQVSYGLNDLFGVPDTITTQLAILGGLVLLYTISAISGVTRGIQILSRFNVILAMGLMAFILIFGPTAFIGEGFARGMGIYLRDFIPMAMFRADPGWLDWWTVFFWGWFLGYGPLMAMFVAKISRGRNLRQIILVVSIVAPIVTCFWFSIVGGSGIAFELATPGSISEPFTGFNLPAALLAITQQLPAGFLISILFLILTSIFVATTGDSMTYTISMVMTGDDNPPSSLRVFWGVAMGATAAILLIIGKGGSGGVQALQNFIVITAVPVSLVLLPSLWNAPRFALKLLREQRQNS